ncbi:hypothetical protein ACFOX0_33555 [Micromonospora zhanjiangensis]|uniref:Uncharacterized protein n=1 Tax=Micromonospora zhanjiangensis TaxID=1522057 RepID=A0ABV8KXT9_9ACTN
MSAAEGTGVLRVDAIDDIGYRRQDDGSLAAFIRARPQAAPATDDRPTGFILHNFDVLPPEDAATLLTYTDPQGRISEAWVHDMYNFTAPLGFRNAFEYRPFSIAHDSFDATPSEDDLELTGFYLSTDIWLPWTTTSSHSAPGERADAILDNRTLGSINGARLNTFLHQVRDTARRLGGEWSVRPAAPIFRSQVDDNGVILDAPPPALPIEFPHST